MQRLGIDLADTGQHIVDEVAIDPLCLLRHHLTFEFAHQRMQFAVGTGLVDEVDGLVGQEAVADVLGRSLYRIAQHALGILHAMELLVLGLQTFEDADGLFDRRFGDVDLLESTHHTLALLKVAVVLLVGG